ncbi:hypothetical protein ACERK3_07985 [Phycisphaerales bacterium AB-hyl4]|uniref:Apea-like HEPN domain-containing protein n=1 Tax=Natronomicrosphaera hydrolytica TaxID=3242702 RepID=A0ABV4U3S7_9BACT
MTDTASDRDARPTTVRHLRRRWKPIKEHLHAEQKNHPTNIRFHRACSWLQRVEQMEGDADLDLVLTGQWIAFNALYGQWNPAAGEPLPDRECWRRFLDRELAMDANGRLADILTEHKRLVLAILDDAYLENYFWKEPSPRKATQTTKGRRQAATWYLEQRWALVLEQVVERIYLLRCQLLHGAATYNSKLNRTSMRRCTTMLGHLLPALMEVWIDHGAEEDWGPMCYPPQG